MLTLFTLLFIAKAHAEVHTIVQANQLFLDGKSEAKIEDLKKSSAAAQPFVVKTLKVKKGDSINFKNLDKMTHNVFNENFDLKAQAPGDSRSQVFDQVGKQTVRCAIHPKMKFNVEVEN